jgi:hypothetical protein
MKKSLFCTVLAMSALTLIVSQLCPAKESEPWLGVHVLTTSGDKVVGLTEVVGRLAEVGINAIVAEVNYGYEYESHPELRAANAGTREQIAKLVAECKKHHVRLIPQFQCLGHQSWSRHTFPLLTKYPEFDESPGQYPDNEGIYCRSWCPLHPQVNAIVFSLMDELIAAFEADAFHVGMDEVFLIGEKACPRCRGKDKAELFAKAVNDYHKHLVGDKKVEMLMWGDRLIDANEIKYGRWEASANDTAGAIDRIPKDVVICDWHYEPRAAYESVPMFLKKGFRVWPASWRKPEGVKAFVEYSLTQKDPRMLGHLNTTWGAVPTRELPTWEPIRHATSSLR